ncbi:MAG: rhomboid family intramembrane serine protease [Bacteroidetes bacterium]|nr:rhomboid family intramembrane serine protease [Bacteroidota bacterium]
MAFGITPRHEQEVTFEELSHEQILITGLETAKRLGWNIGYTSETGFIAYTQFSWSSWSEEVKFKIEGNKVIVKSECTGSQLVDWGKNKQNIESFLKGFKENMGAVAPEEVAKRFLEIKSGTEAKDDLLNQPPQTARDKIKNVFSIFIPTEGYFFTPIIVNINILVFAAMVISGVHFMLPDNDSLINWGANFRPVTLDGQWWRLFTSCFLHIGVIHLLMNLYALIYIGLLLEPQLGKTRFVSAYLLAGIGGSVASLYWHDLTISAGASGAIFGMYGVFLAMLTTNLIEKSARKTLLTSIMIFVGYNLLNGLKGGIDNAAHIGGLVTGMIIGYAFYPSLIKPQQLNLKYLTVALLSILVVSTSFIVYRQTPNDIGQYEEKMKKFVSLESMAMEVYHKDGNTPDAELLKEIKDRGIYYWKESVKVINEADKLNLPEELHRKNEKLLEYCQLRIESYQLLYKAIEEDTDKYKNDIQDYNQKIEALIKELGGQ